MVTHRIEFAIALAFSTALLFAAVAFLQLFGRHRAISKPNLQECPGCGAHNHAGKQKCFCCGYQFGSSPP
jgi:hypothetical protein